MWIAQNRGRGPDKYSSEQKNSILFELTVWFDIYMCLWSYLLIWYLARNTQLRLKMYGINLFMKFPWLTLMVLKMLGIRSEEGGGVWTNAQNLLRRGGRGPKWPKNAHESLLGLFWHELFHSLVIKNLQNKDHTPK